MVCQRRTPTYDSLMHTVCVSMMTMYGVAAICMGKHAVLPPLLLTEAHAGDKSDALGHQERLRQRYRP